MPTPLDQFVKQLEDSGILAGDTLKDFVPPNATPKDGAELAKELVRQKKLTKFQAEEVYRGKGKSLTLGNYVLMEKIGAGGMGEVFKARHRRMDRFVAVKLLPTSLTKDNAAIARFEREVKAAAKISHPNIVSAYDADQANGVHFLVMELVEGSDLSALVKKNGPFSVEKTVNYILQAARGLEAAHAEGIVHRDIKPANLLLDKKGVIKILDMGLARLGGVGNDSPQADLTSTGTIMGTADYMAPEQALDSKTADARADIYALGCSLYHLLTGKATYEGDTLMKKLLAHREQPIPSLRSARPEVPEPIEIVFRRMIAKKIEDRYQTMSEVIAELGRLEVRQEATVIIQQSGNIPSSANTKADNSSVKVSRSIQVVETTHDTKPKRIRKAATKANAVPPSWKNLKVLFGAGLFGLLLLAGIMVYLQTKDRKQIVEVDQPDAIVVETATKSFELLALLDLQKDRVSIPNLTGTNNWTQTGTSLTYTSDGKAGKIVVPLDLKNARDFEIVSKVRRLSGSGVFTFDFPSSDKLGTGLDVVIGGPIKLKLENGRRQIIGNWPDSIKDCGLISMRVRHGVTGQPGSVVVTVDGIAAAQWEGDVSAIGTPLEGHPSFPGQATIGIFCFKDSYEFDSWKLRVFDGQVGQLR